MPAPIAAPIGPPRAIPAAAPPQAPWTLWEPPFDENNLDETTSEEPHFGQVAIIIIF
jgi:hypothetical protein